MTYFRTKINDSTRKQAYLEIGKWFASQQPVLPHVHVKRDCSIFTFYVSSLPSTKENALAQVEVFKRFIPLSLNDYQEDAWLPRWLRDQHNPSAPLLHSLHPLTAYAESQTTPADLEHRVDSTLFPKIVNRLGGDAKPINAYVVRVAQDTFDMDYPGAVVEYADGQRLGFFFTEDFLRVPDDDVSVMLEEPNSATLSSLFYVACLGKVVSVGVPESTDTVASAEEDEE